MSTPTASVVVPSYKGQSKLPTLLGALELQDAPAQDFEVVVVVDGRLDSSPEIVAQAAERGVPVRAVVLEENQGRVSALNAGFRAARGDVLIRCDDDLEPAPDYVSAHIARHLAATVPVGVVGLTRDVLPDSVYARTYGRRRTRLSLDASYRGHIEPWRHWAANCSVTRETWERVGEYSDAYTHYGWEDVDYGYRLHKAGIDVVLAPELETVHHGAATSTTLRALRAYHSGAARRTFEALHPDVLDAPATGGGWWGALVGATTRLSSEARFEALAGSVDRLLPVLPAPVADKLIALTVESASLAGYGNADDVSARF